MTTLPRELSAVLALATAARSPRGLTGGQRQDQQAAKDACITRLCRLSDGRIPASDATLGADLSALTPWRSIKDKGNI
jgi:hypothetical protein